MVEIGEFDHYNLHPQKRACSHAGKTDSEISFGQLCWRLPFSPNDFTVWSAMQNFV